MTNVSGGTATDLQDRTTSPPDDNDGLRDQAQQAAGTAADEGKRLAGVAGDEAQKVAQETKQQAQQVLEEARTQLGEQARTQMDRVVQVLGSVGDDLDRMSAQADSGVATDLVRQAAQQVRGFTGRLDGREPADLLDDVRQFARRRPGTFLLGALAAGVVAGRFARGAKQAHDDAPSSTGTASAAPVPPQRAQAPAPTPSAEATTSLPVTPQAGALADFPADRPGAIS